MFQSFLVGNTILASVQSSCTNNTNLVNDIVTRIFINKNTNIIQTCLRDQPFGQGHKECVTPADSLPLWSAMTRF